MPERARIFTVSTEAGSALAAAPALAGRMHRSTGNLLVARVPDGAWRPPVVHELGPDVMRVGGADDPGRDPALAEAAAWGPTAAPVADYAAAFERFGWLAHVWPENACLRYLRSLATDERPIAYHHEMERGDDLYYEFAWLAAADEELVVAQTYLVGVDATASVRNGMVGPLDGRSVFRAVLTHLGLDP